MRTPVAFLLTSTLVGCTLTGSGVARTEVREVARFDTIVATDIVDVRVISGMPAGSLEVRCDDNVIDHLETTVSSGILTVGFGGASVTASTACEVVTGNLDLVELVSAGVGDITVQGPAWSLHTLRAESVGSLSVDLRAGREGDTGEALLDAPDASEADRSPADHLFIEALDIGAVRVSGVTAATVDVWTASTGDVELSGDTDELLVDASGLGDVRARALQAREAAIYAASVADVQATVTDRVVVENTGIGDVTIYGDPADRSVVRDNVGEVEFR